MDCLQFYTERQFNNQGAEDFTSKLGQFLHVYFSTESTDSSLLLTLMSQSEECSKFI